MNRIRSFSLLAILATVIAAFSSSCLLAVVGFVALSVAYPSAFTGRICVTLISSEILADIITAFKKSIPLVNKMGLDFSSQSLKLNQTYYAHITTIPTVEDVTTTYAVTGQDARDSIVDVPVTVDTRRGVRLKIKHLDRIKDKKELYNEVIGNAGYALAKDLCDRVMATFKTVNFSQGQIFSEANSDLDMLEAVREAMNGVGADPIRNMFVNSAVATVLGADSRIASKDFAGQMPNGTALRRFTNLGGFQEIIEYPDMPLNNSTAVTGGAIEADDDVYTKTAHGLVTGQRVVLTSFSGGTGLTAATVWYFHRLTADTGLLCATPAAAQAGTLGTACTVDATSVVLTPTENVIAFGFDKRAFAVLLGVPDGFDSADLKSAWGIPDNMGFESVTMDGVTMGAVSWEETGTGDLNYMPVTVFGMAAGRQAGTNAVGSKTDYAGYRVMKA